MAICFASFLNVVLPCYSTVGFFARLNNVYQGGLPANGLTVDTRPRFRRTRLTPLDHFRVEFQRSLSLATALLILSPALAMSNLGVYLLANSELRTTNKRFTRSYFLTLSIRMHYERFSVTSHDLAYRIFTYQSARRDHVFHTISVTHMHRKCGCLSGSLDNRRTA